MLNQGDARLEVVAPACFASVSSRSGIAPVLGEAREALGLMGVSTLSAILNLLSAALNATTFLHCD